MNRDLHWRGARAAAAALLALLAAGCGGRDAVRVQLQTYAPPTRDPRLLEIRAQVAGPLTGLRYRWYSVSGECDPQVSDSPATSFRFAEGTTRDRVSVEVWRGDERVAQREIDVQLDERKVRLAAQSRPNIGIEITKVPPYEPEGGDATRADIAGRVSGEVAPDYQVVIYARADAWYIQPHSHTFHAIRADNTWASWTHTGSSYAALVVRPGFDAFTRLDVLPQVGGYVVARTIVEGVR
jgi:hypothetical protein